LKNTFNKENKSFIEKEIEMVKEKEKEDKQKLDKMKEETERLRKLLQKN
jgi:hypothetical protein